MDTLGYTRAEEVGTAGWRRGDTQRPGDPGTGHCMEGEAGRNVVQKQAVMEARAVLLLKIEIRK